MRGAAEFEINFGNCKQEVQVVVTDIGHRGILGMDTLKQWGASMDVRQGKVLFNPLGGPGAGPSPTALESWVLQMEEGLQVAEVGPMPSAPSSGLR